MPNTSPTNLSAPFFLISTDGGTADAYDSIDTVILNTEAIDVIEHEYRLFDATGKQVHLIAVGPEGLIESWRGIWTPDARVVIDHVSTSNDDRALVDRLISHLISQRSGVELADGFDDRVRQGANLFR